VVARLKLLAVDLDGTLLGIDGRPHQADVEALRAAQTRGVFVTIITGRMFSGARAAAEMLGLRGPIACVDGAHIAHAHSGQMFYHAALPPPATEALHRALVATGATAFLLSGDRLVFDEHSKPFARFMSMWTKSFDEVESALTAPLWQAPLTGIVAVGTPQQLEVVLRSIAGLGVTHLRFPVPDSESWAVYVRAEGTDKGQALRWLMQHTGAERESTAVVGDWLNDVPMFQVAGRSFAMSQAPAELKAVASDVLPNHGADGGGIARALALLSW
jgi:Cof subfamily protein (haloacid dehalogenase superfamily)